MWFITFAYLYIYTRKRVREKFVDGFQVVWKWKADCENNLRFFVPEFIFEKYGAIKVSASANRLYVQWNFNKNETFTVPVIIRWNVAVSRYCCRNEGHTDRKTVRKISFLLRTFVSLPRVDVFHVRDVYKVRLCDSCLVNINYCASRSRWTTKLLARRSIQNYIRAETGIVFTTPSRKIKPQRRGKWIKKIYI